MTVTETEVADRIWPTSFISEKNVRNYVLYQSSMIVKIKFSKMQRSR